MLCNIETSLCENAKRSNPMILHTQFYLCFSKPRHSIPSCIAKSVSSKTFATVGGVELVYFENILGNLASHAKPMCIVSFEEKIDMTHTYDNILNFYT